MGPGWAEAHSVRVLLFLALLAAAGASPAENSAGDSAEVRRTDPDNLVSFRLPALWNDDHFANGRHFQRADRPDDKAILAVLAELREHYPTLEQIRTGRTGVHQTQGHRQVSSDEKQINGFDVWEAVYTANVRGDDVIMHDFMMFSDTRFIEVHLIAAEADYETYLPDLLAVVDSMRVN